jgi:hypothetical protein
MISEINSYVNSPLKKSETPLFGGEWMGGKGGCSSIKYTLAINSNKSQK